MVHFGDVSRKISADANNIQFFLEPENYEVPDDQKRYKIDFTSTDSTFTYDQHPLEDVDIRLPRDRRPHRRRDNRVAYRNSDR